MRPKLVAGIEKVIEVGILFLVALTPLPFGSVQLWAVSTFEVIVYFLGISWSIQVYLDRNSFNRITPFGWFLGALGLMAFLQVIPLPQNILRYISPSTSQIFQKATSFLFQTQPLSLYPYDTLKEFFKFMAYVIFYVLVVNRQNLKFYLIGLFSIAGVTFFEAFYGLFELWSGRLHIFWYENLSQDKFAFGTFINRNHYAAFLEMGILTSIGLFVSRISSMSSCRNYKELFFEITRERNIPYFLIAFSSCLAISATFFSGSRAGISLVILGVVLYFFLTSIFYGRNFIIGIFITLSIGSTFWIVRGNTHRVFERFGTILQQRDFRFDIFQDSWVLIKDFIVFGCGFGTYKYVFPLYQFKAIIPPQMHSYIDHAHNEYLEFICEGGFAGFTILFLCGLFIMLNVLRGIDFLKLGVLIGLVCISIHNFVDFPIDIPAIALTYLFLIGFAMVYRRERVFKDQEVPWT